MVKPNYHVFNFTGKSQRTVAVPSIIIAMFMILIGRPLSVFISLIPFKMDLRSNLYTSWVGLRGAVPIVFAIFTLVANVPNAQTIFNIVFFITLVSLLLQGSSIGVIAKKLNLIDGKQEATAAPQD